MFVTMGNALKNPNATSTVSGTWRRPVQSSVLPLDMSARGFTSRPITNSNSVRPRFAMVSMSPPGLIVCAPIGPSTTPATKSAAMVGMRRRSKIADKKPAASTHNPSSSTSELEPTLVASTTGKAVIDEKKGNVARDESMGDHNEAGARKGACALGVSHRTRAGGHRFSSGAL